MEDKSYDDWVSEMIGMREILKNFSNVSNSEVVGMRAPYLKPGRENQFKVIEDFGYIYDSSIGVSPIKTPIWPYTLDYKIPHECKAGTCPTKSYPGDNKIYKLWNTYSRDIRPLQNLSDLINKNKKVE